MERLTELYLQVWDKPLFQMAQGILLGLMIMGGIWLIVTGLEKDEKKGENDDERTGD